MNEAQEHEDLKEVYRHLHELLEEQEYEKLHEELSSMEMVEVAEFLSEVDENDAFLLLNRFEGELKADIFANFDQKLQKALLEYFSPKEMAVLLTDMSSDDRADLFQNLKVEIQDRVLPYLNKAERDDIIHLSSFPRQTAGAVMSSDFATIRSSMSVQSAINKIRKDSPSKETIYYIYVVDDDQRLTGIISLRKLIMADPKDTIEDIIKKDVVFAYVTEDQEEVIRKIEKYDLIAIPVVNAENQMVGIVTHDDAMDIIQEEQTEDIQKMAGMESLNEPYSTISFIRMIQKRAGWLILLFVGETFTATAMKYYEDKIQRAVLLATFIPLIISSGGNSGSQASTLITRAMSLDEINVADWWRVVSKELSIGLMLGFILGIIGFFRITVWALIFPDIYGPHWPLVSVTVGCALVGVVMWGTMMGSLLPIVLKRLGFDPAVSSAPFVATLVDVSGLVIYFSVATLFLKGILL